MSQPQTSLLFPVYHVFLDGSAPQIMLAEEVAFSQPKFEYEIEDEYGRKINGECPAQREILLPRLNVGYYHLTLSYEETTTESLLLAAPPQVYGGTEKTDVFYQKPINNFKSLRRLLDNENLTALHYAAPFPCAADLSVFYRLIQKKNPPLDRVDITDKEHALYLALQTRQPINKDYNDWANNHYDYNKITSFKTKEFAKKNTNLVKLGALAINEVENCLHDISGYCRRRNCSVCAHIELPLAIDYKDFRAWRDRKLLLSKTLSENQFSNYVPYNPQALVAAYYEPFISLIRQSMSHADILYFDKPQYLQRVLCEDAPFPDKLIEYDVEALLAIIAIESHRSRCRVVALETADLSDNLRNCLIKYGIGIEEQS